MPRPPLTDPSGSSCARTRYQNVRPMTAAGRTTRVAASDRRSSRASSTSVIVAGRRSAALRSAPIRPSRSTRLPALWSSRTSSSMKNGLPPVRARTLSASAGSTGSWTTASISSRPPASSNGARSMRSAGHGGDHSIRLVVRNRHGSVAVSPTSSWSTWRLASSTQWRSSAAMTNGPRATAAWRIDRRKPTSRVRFRSGSIVERGG